MPYKSRADRVAYNREYAARNKGRMAAYRRAYKVRYKVRAKSAVRAYLEALPIEAQLRLLMDSHFAPGSGKRDPNEPVIVNELRNAGYAVEYNAPPLPDLTATNADGDSFYVEVKLGYKGRGLSRGQNAEFAGLDLPVFIAKTARDVKLITAGEVQPAFDGPGDGDDRDDSDADSPGQMILF